MSDILPFFSLELHDLCVHVSAAGSQLLTHPGLRCSFLSHGGLLSWLYTGGF